MRSLKFLEPCKHGLAYCLFVGGMVPNDRLLLLPWLKKKKKKNSIRCPDNKNLS